MGYASTTWGTAVQTNKSRLDKVQSMALRVILGAMKTTPMHDTEKSSRLDKVQNMALRVILGAMKTTSVHNMEKKQPM